MKHLLFTVVGVVVGGVALGSFLNLASKGSLGAGLQSVAQYANEGFAVNL